MKYQKLLVYLLLLVGSCSMISQCDQVELGKEFVLARQDQVQLSDTDLIIKAVTIIEGLDGSMEIGVGSVSLLVSTEENPNREVYMETGDIKSIDSYRIEFIEVIYDHGEHKVRLLINRD